ncbi:MAG TPA: hypothetical protein VGE52_13940 [Pirellulales bacterium]
MSEVEQKTFQGLRAGFPERLDVSCDAEGEADVEAAAHAVQRLADELRARLERSLSAGEFHVAGDGLASIRAVANTLRCLTRTPLREATAAQTDPRRAGRASSARRLLLLAVQVILAVVVALGFFLPLLPAWGLGLLFAIFASIALVEQAVAPPPQVEARRVRSSEDAPLRVNSAALFDRLLELAAIHDAAVQRHATLMKELRELRGRKAEAAPEGNAHLPKFQQLLGAANRNHPHLRDMVESHALEAIESAGLTAVSYSAEAGRESYFDVQHDVDGRLSSPVEIYPALLSAEGKIRHRGRVVTPKK